MISLKLFQFFWSDWGDLAQIVLVLWSDWGDLAQIFLVFMERLV